MGNDEIEIKDMDFYDGNYLTFQYEYEFIPAGMMTRFIVKAHRYLLDWNESNKACWKKGAYVHFKKASGKVRLYDNVSNKRIEIHIVGSNQRQNRELLQRIRSYFDEIHSSIMKLKVIERIQCNCNPNCQYKYDYKTLIRFEEHGHEETICEKTMIKVSVTSLLDGIESLKERQKERERSMEKYPQVVFHSIINNDNHNDNKNNSVNRNNNDNKNSNKNENNTTISIEIRNIIDALHGDLQDMKEEITAKEPELTGEFERVEQGLSKLNNAESKEEIVRSGALRRINRFIQEIQDEETLLGKTVKNIKHGVSIAQDLADKYNTIAEWCGIPVVPKLFMKK